MEQPNVDEQLSALEAALDLAQHRLLPVVVPAALPADPRPRRREGDSQALALSLLKEMQERVAHLEAEEALYRQSQVISEALHHEEREAIEVITDEVATLKKRTARFEQWLAHMQNEVLPAQQIHNLQLQPTAGRSQPLLIVFALAAAGVGLLLFVLLRGI